jgi:cell division protein FtsZ
MVNLDFADIRTVMAEMGKAMMGTGEADGDNRAIRAAEAAISNPLLEETNMAGARGLLINITGGDDLTLFEVDQAANRIRQEVAEEANIIFGSAIDSNLEGRIRVSVVATGIDTPVAQSEPVGPRLRIAVGGGAPIPMPMAAQAAYAAQQQAGPVAHGSNVVQLEAVAPEPVLAEPAPRQGMAAGHGLFTSPSEAQAAPARPSLFKRATFGLRRNHAEPEARMEPQIGEAEPTATVRQSAAEAEVAGLDIPAFLRRQH